MTHAQRPTKARSLCLMGMVLATPGAALAHGGHPEAGAAHGLLHLAPYVAVIALAAALAIWRARE
ncbi:hypothetical protein JANAI62_34920 [Jannaschia pagri]|uniref:Uncharacterized protein n=1 Tax=Jannaschia pagri TaxID=2829797 RepID=A0ABQ4NRJ1_9RHOB|nr:MULTISPECIES: hypothetical protein [unclassified Jannaschia]GIT93034.1 hypothetical protein JANAI61_34920 [Jannaschia sp. AI_61]GIT96869.1 hypothetical protein JANAI62_34920 [Jannaschia sp. AI_62]